MLIFFILYYVLGLFVSLYDHYIKKTLREYDRLIVETNSKLKTSGCNIIDVKNFTELLDARDNLNLPIIYLLKVDDEYLMKK